MSKTRNLAKAPQGIGGGVSGAAKVVDVTSKATAATAGRKDTKVSKEKKNYKDLSDEEKKKLADEAAAAKADKEKKKQAKREKDQAPASQNNHDAGKEEPNFVNGPFGFNRIAFMKNMTTTFHLLERMKELDSFSGDKEELVSIVDEIFDLLRSYPFRHGLKDVAPKESPLDFFINQGLTSFLDVMHDTKHSVDLSKVVKEISAGCKSFVAKLIKAQMAEQVIVAPSPDPQLCFRLTGSECVRVVVASSVATVKDELPRHIQVLLDPVQEELKRLALKEQKDKKELELSNNKLMRLRQGTLDLIDEQPAKEPNVDMLLSLYPGLFSVVEGKDDKEKKETKKKLREMVWEYYYKPDELRLVRYETDASKKQEKLDERIREIASTNQELNNRSELLRKNAGNLLRLISGSNVGVCTGVSNYPVPKDDNKNDKKDKKDKKDNKDSDPFGTLKKIHEHNINHNFAKLQRYRDSFAKLTQGETTALRLCDIFNYLYDFSGRKDQATSTSKSADGKRQATSESDFSRFRHLISHLPDLESKDVKQVLSIVNRRSEELHKLGVQLIQHLIEDINAPLRVTGFCKDLEGFHLPLGHTDLASVTDLPRFLNNANLFYQLLEQEMKTPGRSQSERTFMQDFYARMFGQTLSWFDDDRVKDWQENSALLKNFNEEQLMRFRSVATDLRDFRNGRNHSLTDEDRETGNLLPRKLRRLIETIMTPQFKLDLDHVCRVFTEYSNSRPNTPPSPPDTPPTPTAAASAAM